MSRSYWPLLLLLAAIWGASSREASIRLFSMTGRHREIDRLHLHRRSGGVLVACLALLLASTIVRPVAAAPVELSRYHGPPWLVERGRPVTLAYALLDSSVTGALYVRNSLQRSFTRLPLVRGPYCPGDPVDAAAMRRDRVCGDALVARVPGKLVAASKLFYYAVLRDPTSGGSVTVPAGGAGSPQRVWVVDRLLDVPLGAHRFGHVRAPDAIVARAGPEDVGFLCCSDPPGGDGPSSFDVARDGSIWLLDRLNHRLLAWRPGRPTRPVRAVRLPRNLNVSDFALGPDGTIYARAGDTADLGRGNKNHLYALTPAGRVRWKAPTTVGVGTAPLQIGPDGALYWAQACGVSCAPFGGSSSSWTPLTTPAGRPLSLAERRRLTSPFQPLPGGLKLVSELSYTVARFALVDQADEVVRVWRVTSRTRLGPMRAAPALVGGDLVLPLDVSRGPRWERLILRLAPAGGTRQRFALDADPVVGEVNPFAALRVGPDGGLYELRTDHETGVSIARYLLGPTPVARSATTPVAPAASGQPGRGSSPNWQRRWPLRRGSSPTGRSSSSSSASTGSSSRSRAGAAAHRVAGLGSGLWPPTCTRWSGSPIPRRAAPSTRRSGSASQATSTSSAAASWRRRTTSSRPAIRRACSSSPTTTTGGPTSWARPTATSRSASTTSMPRWPA